jgi:hypothetical protein
MTNLMAIQHILSFCHSHDSFEVVYDQKPPYIFSYMPNVSKVQGIDNTLTILVTVLGTLKKNLVMAQNHMRQQVD